MRTSQVCFYDIPTVFLRFPVFSCMLPAITQNRAAENGGSAGRRVCAFVLRILEQVVRSLWQSWVYAIIDSWQKRRLSDPQVFSAQPNYPRVGTTRTLPKGSWGILVIPKMLASTRDAARPSQKEDRRYLP